jgi:cbb3-type cytochrome oxidase maturation protein
MSILIYLIPITLFLGIVGLSAFMWSLKNKQFDDLDGEASRILFSDEKDKKIN